MSVTPVFVMATPRSGSTLLQRVLTTYDEVGSTAEPWVLLPPLLALHQHPAQDLAGGGPRDLIHDF